MLPYSETPIVQLHHPIFEAAAVTVFVKREDLNHPTVSGNKWWKLKYNLEEAAALGKPILTFGGAYSNHIYATAAAAKSYGIGSFGVIRGERIEPLNSILSFAESQGMQLHFITREKYKMKEEAESLKDLQSLFGEFYLIPEGGTNSLAVRACAEFAKTYVSELMFDELYLPVGTGGTIAGIICGLEGKRKVKGVSVLKDGTFLKEEIAKLVRNFSSKDYGNWNVLTSYHHGGYAKRTKELERFIVTMYEGHGLPLDFVYTGKLMWAVVEEVRNGNITQGSKILVLHTGGLQASNLLRK